MDVLDNCDRVYLASQCGKNVKGAFDEGVLTILAMCHLTQTGDSDTLLLRKVEASTGDLSRMVHALKRYLEPKLKKVEQTFLSAHIQQTETSESCVRARYDSPPPPPLEEGRRYLLDHLSPAFRQKDLSPRPPLLRGEGESNEALRKHEKGRQECLPHLHTRILNGSTSLYAGVALIDWRTKQLNVTIACINQAYHLRKRVDP